jgi:hypothetical protein
MLQQIKRHSMQLQLMSDSDQNKFDHYTFSLYWFCYTGSRLHGFAVDVSDSMITTANDPASTRCAYYSGAASDGEVITLNCACPTRGRWVKVQILDTAQAFLSLCEVEVFGIISD